MSSGGLTYDTPVVYQSLTDYWGENNTLADYLWDALDTDPVTVAISDVWAKQHHLPQSIRFPWDDSKGLYYIKAFHQLHCLVCRVVPPSQLAADSFPEAHTLRLHRL